MFSKIALFKFCFVPLAALMFLAQVTVACPGGGQHHKNDDNDPLPLPADRNCRMDRDRLPRIIRPDGDTVWSIGDWARVRWEGRGRDVNKRGGDDKGPDSKDRPDDRRRRRCRPRLVLFNRRDDDSRPVVLGEDFDIDDGFLDVPVPNVRPDDDYRVIMQLGRLESRSDQFRIRRERRD